MNETFEKFLSLSVFLCGILSLIFFGIVGIGRDSSYVNNFDMEYLYVAGKCWNEGLSPYRKSIFMEIAYQIHSFPLESSFAYPPQTGLLCVFLSIWPIWIARIWMIAINLACVFSLVYFCLRMLQNRTVSLLSQSVLAAIIVGNPFVTHVVWMGQTSLIVTAGVVGGWYFMKKAKFFLSGILFAISTIKPQLGILPLFWIVLERQWRIVIAMCMGILLMSAIPIAVEGPIKMIFNWFYSLREYQTHIFGLINFEHSFGLRSLAWTLGINIPNLMIIGVFLTFLLWHYRDCIVQESILSILVAATVLIIFAHDYDLVILSPLFGTLWLLIRHNRSAVFGGFCLLFGLFFPQRTLRELSSHQWVWHIREVVVLIALIWLLWISVKCRPKVSLSK